MNADIWNRHGFTLIEVLVALAIFAAIALISHRTLSSIFDTRERLDLQSTTLRDQALFFARLENDLLVLMPRAIRNGDGLSEAALVVSAATSTADDAVIVFTRAGFAAGSGTSAAPQRVGYRLKNNSIEMLLWDGLDHAPRAAPHVYPALKNIREFRWRVLPAASDNNAAWRLNWPAGGAVASGAPAALEVTVTPADGAPLVRVFVLRPLGAPGAS